MNNSPVVIETDTHTMTFPSPRHFLAWYMFGKRVRELSTSENAHIDNILG